MIGRPHKELPIVETPESARLVNVCFPDEPTDDGSRDGSNPPFLSRRIPV
jgi:hypothetical protein